MCKKRQCGHSIPLSSCLVMSKSSLSLCPPRVTLKRQKATAPSKRPHPPERRWIVSWDGLEHERARVIALAHRVRTADAAVRAAMPSSVATGLICEAIRDPTLARSPEVAVRELHALHHDLVWTTGVDFDLIRREWATILNPVQSERDRCDALVARAIKKEERRRLW